MSLPGRSRVARVRDQRGFGMVELTAAMGILVIGVLGVFTMFQAGVVSVRNSGYVTTAAVLADSEMEGFRAIKYETIGLSTSAVDAADSVYKDDLAYTVGGGASTALASGIDASATTLTVTSASGFPVTNGYRVKIETEIVRVTAGAGTTSWTVKRGVDATFPKAHSASAAVSIVQRVHVDACGLSPCTTLVPTKLVTGADGRKYRLDTYATWSEVASSNGAEGRSVKLLTVVVRDQASPYRVWARVASTFDSSTG